MHKTLRLLALLPLCLCVGEARSPAQAPPGPSIDDLINLKRVGSPAISPDGHWLAYGSDASGQWEVYVQP